MSRCRVPAAVPAVARRAAVPVPAPVVPPVIAAPVVRTPAPVPTVVETNATVHGQQFTNTDVDTQGSISLTLGLQWRPTDRLSFGASFIQRQRLSVRGSARVQIAIDPSSPFIPPVGPILNAPPATSEIRFVTGFTPMTIQVGGAYQLTERLQVNAALQYYQWSDYVTTTGTKPFNEFDDTFVPRIGLEYRLFRNFDVRAGFYYEPTPVTDQPQGFNLLGADRYVPSIGFGWRFEDPFGYYERPIRLDFAAFYHFFKARDFDESTGPPPLDLIPPEELLPALLLVPNFLGAIDVDEPHEFDGRVFGMTLSLTTTF